MSVTIYTVRDEHFRVEIGGIKIFKCPNCDKNDIKFSYNFCPYCGVILYFDLKENEK